MRNIELELTSACNARCPLCKRTQLISRGVPVHINHYSIDDIERYFDPVDLRNSKVKFCGVLGDPIACPDLHEISEYFLNREVKHIEVSTNAGLKTMKFWKRYGELSKKYSGKLEIHFAIDGVETNEYRVGVNLKKVWQNVDSYLEGGGNGSWQFIIFDYNKHEVERAREIAQEKGMKFMTRVAWKNDLPENDRKLIEDKARSRDYA